MTASTIATEVGVSSIGIYKSDGSYVTTINGSVSNGLIRASTTVNKGVYPYYGTSGISYYAEVTVFAENATASDSRTVTTATVKAP